YHAGDTVFVKGALQSRIPGEGAGKQGNWVVTAFAVARVLDPLLLDQHIDVLSIERRAEGIAMRRLPPLPVCFLVALGAILGCREVRWHNEAGIRGLCLAG